MSRTIFWILIECLAVLVENWILYDFYARFHRPKFRPPIQTLSQWAAILLTSAMALVIDRYTTFSGIITFLCIGMIFLYGLFFLEGTVFSKLFYPLIAFGMIFIINISVNTLCSFALDRSQETLFVQQDQVRFFSIIATKFCFFLVTRWILGAFQKGVILHRQEWALMTGISCISLLIGVSVMHLQLSTDQALSPFYCICIGGIFCIDLFVFFMLSRISTQNQKITRISLLELQLSQQKQAIADMNLLQSKIRQSNHDHMNHLLCLQELIEKERYSQAGDYLAQLVRRNPEIRISRVQVADQFLQAILSVKIEQCEENHIPISLKTDDAVPKCESADLCVLLANLLDNAIEASQQVKSPKIEVILARQKNYYTIVIKNRIEGSVLGKNASLKTTKRDRKSHGIGVQSIREIVNRYHGMMEYYEEDDWFVAHVWIRET